MNFEGIHNNPMGHPGPRRDFHNQMPNREQRPISTEEMKVWNDCINESIYKAGVPFAIGVQLISAYTRDAFKQTPPVQPQPVAPPGVKLAKNCVVFVGNVLLGVFLYSPVCYKRLQEKVLVGQQNLIREKEESIIAAKTEKPILQVDDSNFRSDLNFDERDPSFSSLNLDFDTTYDKSVLEEEPSKQKYQMKTTYEELRKKNRQEGLKSSASIYSPPPPSSIPPPPPPSSSEDLGFRSFSEPLVESPPPAQTPTRPKRKNKYGDEIEF